MASRALNVLVYSGTGTTSESVKHCMYTLRRLLYPNYAVIPIEENTLLKEPWTSTCALFVMPGGADLGYCRVLSGAGNRLISQYVRNGGQYLGFCAGGYYGSERCEFEVGNRILEVIGTRELGFFPGTCRGAAFRGFEYHSERGARAVRLALNSQAFSDANALATTASGVEVLASYEDDITLDDASGKAAIVYCKIGKGAAMLTGPHPEFEPAILAPQPDLPDYSKLVGQLVDDTDARTRLLRACLSKLNLEVNSDNAAMPCLTPLHVASLYPDEAQELFHSWDGIISKEGNEEFIRADIDVFKILRPEFSASTTEATLMVQDPKDTGDDGVRTLVLYESLHPAEAASFNYREYYGRLKHYRAAEPNIGRSEATDWGNILMYGSVVTSTNTMLEKNSKLLAKLPSGFTFTARTQTAARGRGSNVWVAPPGQLIFSTVINHPHKIAFTRPMVFIQYLAGVAIVEAIHSYGVGYDQLEIKLKWPNDIYAIDASKPGSQPVKIGGILSNCSFNNGQYQVVLGVGLNATNERPTTSLNALLPSSLEPFVLERLLARIVTRLEVLYKAFCSQGFAGDLEQRYYKHWLHDRQIITLESEGGQRARVVGITMDWGMLKVDELGPNDKPTGRAWKLQSDENSFDFWKGLVRTKI